MYLEVIFYESGKTVVGKMTAMVIANKCDPLLTVVKKAVTKLIKREGKDATDSAVDAAIKRIQSITTRIGDPCACDLLEFLHEPDATLENLNSTNTPILEGGIIHINILNEPIDIDDEPITSSAPPAKKPKIDAYDVMLGKTAVKVNYLQYDENIDGEAQIDEQIKRQIYILLEEMGLGYRDDKQKRKLATNTQKIKNTLCFVQKYWKVLLSAEFPHLPKGRDTNYAQSKFISALQGTTRLGSR